MAWHYLPELLESLPSSPEPAAEPSDPSSSATESSAPSSSTPTAGKCFSDDSGTACCPCSLSGMTSGPSMGAPGVDAWISSLEVSPVSRSRALEPVEARTTRATCGPIPPGSFARWDPGSRSWRTFQLSLLTGTLDRYSETWPRAGTVSGGIVSARPPSAPLIRGTGSGSSPHASRMTLPTPNRPNGGRRVPEGARISGMAAYDHKTGKKIQVGLEAIAATPERWLPTPTKGDARNSRNATANRSPGSKGNPGVTLADVAFATPTKSDASGGPSYSKPPSRQGSAPLKETIRGGPLNPALHLWLMGWPTAFTSLKPLATDRFRSWLRWHSAALSQLLNGSGR